MNIADLARVRDEDLAADPAGQTSGAGARTLMGSIMGEEREPVRRRLPARRGIGFGMLAAALATALVVWTPFGGPATEYANAAVSIKTWPDFVEVAINDPEADAEKFTEAFRAVGIEADVKKAPVAPEDVGKLITPYMDGKFPAGTGLTITHQTEGCRSAWCGKLSMPVDYTGKLVFGIGRPAAPGERYATPVEYTVDPGAGVMDGDKVHGKPVSEVRADMERAGMRIEYQVIWATPEAGGGGYNVDAAYIKDDWPVSFVLREASDLVSIGIENPAGVPKDSLPQAPDSGAIGQAPMPLPSAWWRD
ncbi:hypothetical protein ABZ897_54350 [Nonomuraea sp. NPDC046802]|uniref:hypothetical protein n=1 Tax=Nonomuraea sp. NPDC046802 TaxID=3154919 RepID=UPI0033EBDE94